MNEIILNAKIIGSSIFLFPVNSENELNTTNNIIILLFHEQ